MELLKFSAIATNVAGMGFATAFRLLLYRHWVYGDHRKRPTEVGEVRKHSAVIEG